MAQSQMPEIDEGLQKAMEGGQELDQDTIDRAVEQGIQENSKATLEKEKMQSSLNKQVAEKPE